MANQKLKAPVGLSPRQSDGDAVKNNPDDVEFVRKMLVANGFKALPVHTKMDGGLLKAITAFQKKPEFGPSQITVTNVKMENVEMDYLVESTSSLLIDGKKVETSQNVKDRMYGAEFGVSSDETRTKEYKN